MATSILFLVHFLFHFSNTSKKNPPKSRRPVKMNLPGLAKVGLITFEYFLYLGTLSGRCLGTFIHIHETFWKRKQVASLMKHDVCWFSKIRSLNGHSMSCLKKNVSLWSSRFYLLLRPDCSFSYCECFLSVLSSFMYCCVLISQSLFLLKAYRSMAI